MAAAAEEVGPAIPPDPELQQLTWDEQRALAKPYGIRAQEKRVVLLGLTRIRDGQPVPNEVFRSDRIEKPRKYFRGVGLLRGEAPAKPLRPRLAKVRGAKQVVQAQIQPPPKQPPKQAPPKQAPPIQAPPKQPSPKQPLPKHVQGPQKQPLPPKQPQPKQLPPKQLPDKIDPDTLSERSTLKELLQYCKEAGLQIPGRWKMGKTELWAKISPELEHAVAHDDSGIGGSDDEDIDAKIAAVAVADAALEHAALPKPQPPATLLAQLTSLGKRYLDSSALVSPAPTSPPRISLRLELSSRTIAASMSDVTPRLDVVQIEGNCGAVNRLLEALRHWTVAGDDAARAEHLGSLVLPLLIPSKGRAGQSKLLAECEEDGGMPVAVAVQLDQAADYAAAYPSLALIVLPWGGGIGYSREVLRTLAAGRFTVDGKVFEGGSPAYMLDDNVTFVTNRPLLEREFVHARVVPARVRDALLYAQQAMVCAGMHTAASSWGLLGFEELGSAPDNKAAPVFGRQESYSCYKAVVLHAPRADERGVHYFPGMNWPEDVAFVHALRLADLHLLKMRWPYRFRRDRKPGSTCVKKLRLCVADFFQPWAAQCLEKLDPADRQVLNDVLRQCMAIRSDRLRLLEPATVLYELDWRHAAVAEGSLTVAEVSKRPVNMLLTILSNMFGEVKDARAALLDVISKVIPTLRHPNFVADCVLDQADAVCTKFKEDPKTLEQTVQAAVSDAGV